MRGAGPHLQQRARGSEKVSGLPDPDHVDHLPIQIMPSSQLGSPVARSRPIRRRSAPGRDSFAARQHRPDAARHLVRQCEGCDDRAACDPASAASHGPCGAPRRSAQRITAIAPMTSSRRMSRCPIFEVFPSLCLPPLECCRGTNPSQAAKSRPRRNWSIGGAKVSTASAVIGPTPGMVCNWRGMAAAGLVGPRRVRARDDMFTDRRAQHCRLHSCRHSHRTCRPRPDCRERCSEQHWRDRSGTPAVRTWPGVCFGVQFWL
jgi:hypothetical protein